MPLLRLLILVLAICTGGATKGWAGEVRFIYLVPADRQEKPAYREAIGWAARHFQAWLSSKTDGLTFELADPLVLTVRSDRPAAWFQSAERHANYHAFYRNASEELSRLGVAKAGDPTARYVVYVDADHACGQSGAGGNGLAIVSANDLRGLVGEAIVPACAQSNGAEIAGRCRWIGGMGHELLHTLGLRHPDRSPACQTGQCRSRALMLHGYISYPEATLLEEELLFLRGSPFIGPNRLASPASCAR
ncbi:hypothetical protein J2Y55_004892 [Bosea sp. BE125]|uniref:hypothetical protein n=1 Tax=Bosea sp. BE125 TaxID=2817909 RepID=UPI0028637010|nr:hypothetical protein [Bosea sp. BE125]MDR6873863.1 hypothetical protein [Bosea sp. BE125]